MRLGLDSQRAVVTEPQEVADLVLLLASDRASNVTGTTLSSTGLVTTL